MTEIFNLAGERYVKVILGARVKNDRFASFCFINDCGVVVGVGSVDNVSDQLMMKNYNDEAQKNGAKYFLVKAHNSRDERKLAERKLRSKFLPLSSRRTEKYVGAVDLCNKLSIDHAGFASTDDLYEFLAGMCYFWDVEGKFFYKKSFPRFHEGSKYLELQVRSSKSGELSSLRIRAGKAIINAVEGYLRERLSSILVFEKRFDSDLYPPNNNDVYVYLYANFENYIEVAYSVVERLRLFDVLQIHERDARNGNEPFVDVKFDVKNFIEFRRLSSLAT